MTETDQTFLTGPQVLARYQISHVTRWRWTRDAELAFPQPMKINRLLYWRLEVHRSAATLPGSTRRWIAPARLRASWAMFMMTFSGAVCLSLCRRNPAQHSVGWGGGVAYLTVRHVIA